MEVVVLPPLNLEEKSLRDQTRLGLNPEAVALIEAEQSQFHSSGIQNATPPSVFELQSWDKNCWILDTLGLKTFGLDF